MIKRPVVLPPEHIYPADPWKIVETRFDPAHHGQAETVFALSNGYLGIRGTVDEGRPVRALGTFVNGLYESRTIHYAEDAYGLASVGQTMICVPDATVFRLYVDDEPFLPSVANCHTYRRQLDMRAGTLTRDLVWSTAGGKHVRIRTSRMVSLDQRHLVVIDYRITMLDHPAPIAIRTGLSKPVPGHGGWGAARPRARPDPRLAPEFEYEVLREEARVARDRRMLLGYQTAHSGMALGVGAHHLIDSPGWCQVDTESHADNGCMLVITSDAKPGETIGVTKYVTYHTSRRESAGEMMARCGLTLDRAARQSYEQVARTQRHELDRAWDRADVRVDAHDPEGRRLQQAIRWNLFQLIQASWRAEGAGIPAKGLTSQTYEGHYFWDTEIYVLPFLAYTQPRIARNLLRFRHSMLDQARARARVMNHRGALFPWRTINGEEASANFESGTAQYHINADVAYAVRKYLDVRGDPGFLSEIGAEMLVETARLWEDLGFYDDSGAFHIHGVTGPDEYTTLVNDNTYTNLMARLNLAEAAMAVRRLETEDHDGYVALRHRCGLVASEIEGWERAAGAMHIPYHAGLGINPQDQAFLDKEVWDLDSTPPDKFPLLLHYHPLTIYRHQVLKQADIVLAMFLAGDQFTAEQKKRNFEYYDPLTTGDSSLSAGVESIVAAEIGEERKALSYFRYALLIDLADRSDSTPDGVHIGSAGSAWMALIHGFGGVRDYGGHLAIDPRLPARWRSLEFSLRFHGRQLRVSLTHGRDEYRLVEGEALEITVRGRPVTLVPGRPEVVTADPGKLAG